MDLNEIFASLREMEPKVLDELIKAAQKEKEVKRKERFRDLTDQLGDILHQLWREFPNVDWYFDCEEDCETINLADYSIEDILERLVL